MQNRYVGDLGDFGKYGLLRHLCPDLRLGVVWYRVDDETHNNDGRHVRYLNIDALTSARWGVKPCAASDERRHLLRFRACDPVLYDALKELVTRGHRDVRAIPPRHILPYGTAFVEDVLTGPRRDEWLARALDTTKDSDVVFLDPDNGLEVASRPRHSPLAPKYVFYDEVRRFYQRGHSLVIYQHFDRTPDLVARCREKLAEQLTGQPTVIHALCYRRGTARVFFILPAARHETLVAERVRTFLAGHWARHFRSV